MTCPTCNDRGVIPNRRLHAGRVLECPDCGGGRFRDPVRDDVSIMGVVILLASAAASLAVVSLLTDLDEQFLATLASWWIR